MIVVFKMVYLSLMTLTMVGRELLHHKGPVDTQSPTCPVAFQYNTDWLSYGIRRTAAAETLACSPFSEAKNAVKIVSEYDGRETLFCMVLRHVVR